MHGAAIVPKHDAVRPPSVAVDELRLRRMAVQVSVYGVLERCCTDALAGCAISESSQLRIRAIVWVYRWCKRRDFGARKSGSVPSKFFLNSYVRHQINKSL